MAESLGGKFVITAPDAPEWVFEITQAIVRIGRSPAPQNDIVLEHGWVSRSHARIYCDRLPYRVQDLRSSNGTTLNGVPLPPEEIRPLKDGDIIAIGPFRLRFVAPAEPAAKAPAPPEPEAALKGVKLRPAPKVAPPPPPVPPPEAPTTWAAPERWVGMDGGASRWLQYLPPIYSEDEFLGRFLCIFEDLLGAVQQLIGHFDLFLDPATAPETFLPWLNEWLGVFVDERWSPQTQRQLLREAAWLYQARGTRAGLERHLRLVTDAEVEIVEHADGPHTFRVVLRPRGAPVDPRMVERIIELNRPAHTRYTLQILA